MYSRINNLKNFIKLPLNVEVTHFQGNNISKICGFYYNLHTAIIIDNSYNIIEILEKNCFHNINYLKCVLLQYNAITHVKSASFHNLTNFSYINLSSNPISHLLSNIITQCFQVLTISLEHNSLIDIDKFAFSDLNIKLLESNDHRLCCLVPSDNLCTAKKPWFKSCTYPLPRYSIKVTFIIISVLIISVNIVSVFIHIKDMEMSDSFNKVVIAVNFNDMIFRIYLTLIWAANLYFGEDCAIKENKWQTSLNYLFCLSLVVLFIL